MTGIALMVSALLLAQGCATAPAVVKIDCPKPEAAPAPEKRADGEHYTIDDWWPNRLDLRVLRSNALKGDPMDASFDYGEAFSKVDLKALKQDIEASLKDSKAWWPADWGHYGGLMIRLAWHSAGTYRVTDGRGGAASGTIRFAPLNSWPDNANLDKARRLLWPVKQKYGRSVSWADLMILTGNVALESMGFKTLGFGGGRADVYEPTDINWGPETEWLADQRHSEDGTALDKRVAASQMGLIYVNPQGPGGNSDPLAAAHHIRRTFARMAMNDEETVALIAGGHTLGKAHGAAMAAKHVGVEPEGAPLEEQGMGWKNSYRSGKGADTITSGLEGAWTYTPTQWSHDYFSNLFEHEWELVTGPGGAKQWSPKGETERMVPDAHIKGKEHKVMMLTTDLSLIKDPAYRVISKRFYENPKSFEDAFARAWFKLTHRDMGPHVRLLGAEVPEPQLWQDPVPEASYKAINAADIKALKAMILKSGLTNAQLVKAAWSAASSFRGTDLRGGANGARVRLAPQKDWAANEPAELAKVLSGLEAVQTAFNKKAKKGKKVSMADVIVLGGGAAIERAAKQAGITVTVPFASGRTDATQEMTDLTSFGHLEPETDGFRNYVGAAAGDANTAERLVERADMLSLSAAEMAVLVGGLRVIGANHGGTSHGVFTETPGALNNHFFVNLLDNGVVWKRAAAGDGVYEGRVRGSDAVKWTGTAVDLVFGSNSQLRAIAEVYAAEDAKEKFVNDFVAVWDKVMTLDRFDLR
ncbi:MAG: catalase/peroxidase HPI [Myxococcota bacterium]